MVGGVFSSFVLVGEAPEVGRMNTAIKVAEAVVSLQSVEHGGNPPVGNLGKALEAQGVDTTVFPGKRWGAGGRASLGNVYGSGGEGIAVV